MLRVSILSLSVVATLGFSGPSSRGSVRPTSPSADTVPPLARFLEGRWHCRGGTPAGRVLESDVAFAMSLGARWLSSEHTDVPPGPYHAFSLWPTDTAHRALASTVYDNFGGARRFFGAWGTDSIVWLRDTTEGGARLESFTYRRTSANAYWYAWHVRRANGAPVALGDSATCRRS
jgi:hypothetical protein